MVNQCVFCGTGTGRLNVKHEVLTDVDKETTAIWDAKTGINLPTFRRNVLTPFRDFHHEDGGIRLGRMLVKLLPVRTALHT
jgi:hypothetical protein